jgi:titin
LSSPVILGDFTDFVSIDIRQDTPREPICTLRANSKITCFSAYGNYNLNLGNISAGCRNLSPNAAYSGFQNGITTPFLWISDAWGYGWGCSEGTVGLRQFTGTISSQGYIDVQAPLGKTVTSLSGGYFEGSVSGEGSYSNWGRLFALTSDGQLFAMGDGKFGERQDGISNTTVTDTWAPSLVQNPVVTSSDRTMIPKSGGATITLNGSFLVGVTAVTVGGNPVSSWVEGSDGTTLKFTNPSSQSGGTVAVSVSTSAGAATLNNAFTYGDSPSAPTITGISPVDGAVTIGWSSPFSSGSSAVTSYTVSVLPGGATCTWTAGPLNCTVSGLTNGTTYRATVRAYSALGPGLSSANSAAFVPYKAPSVPPIVSIAPGDGQITVTWSAAVNNGSAITRYDVEAQPGGNSCSTSGTGTSCTISALTNGTAYSISVYATNDAGGGEVSTSGTLITPRTLAGSPTNVVINPGDRQLGVSWRAPSSNGGSAVTSYTVTAQPGSVTCTAIAPSTSCNLLGLSNGSVYTITVVATNPAGDSVSSSTATGSPVTIPGKPTISATEPGSNSVLVRWRAPSATGGASVSSYTVVASPGGNSCTTTGAVLFCTVTGLDNGTTYAFTVTATNSAGTGSASASYNGVPATIASAPRNISVTPVNGGITATWAIPSYDGGTAITGYIATVRSTGDTCSTNASTRTCTFSGLVNGSTYVVDVVATNNAGSSEAASSSNVTPRTVPSKPVQVTLTPGASSIRVSWAAPLSDGGSPITSYLATATPGVGVTCTSTGTYCDFLSLTPGTNYSVTVVAVNAAGTGAASSSISSMPFTNPGAPNTVGAVADDGQVLVTWAAPSSTGGSDITGYVATATLSTNVFTCTAPSTATSCLIKGLTNGSKYSIKVSASNGAGAGPESSVAATTTPRGISNAPTLVSVDPQNQSLVVKWRAITTSADNNGSAISKYTAKAMPSGQTCQVDGFTTAGNGLTVANTTCTISGLTNGAIQSVTVSAVNEAGTSASSSAISTTPRSAPGAPVGVKLTPLNGGVSISWNAPIDSGGTPIIRYTGSATPTGTAGSVSTCIQNSGDSRSCLITGLSNGTSYTVTVVATNGVGDSSPSVSQVVIPANVPTAPTSVVPTVSNGSISIKWKAAQDNGSPILSYRVDLAPGDYSCEITDLSFLGCTISDLDNGVPYSVSVFATNAVGDSASASVNGTVTPRAIPSPVQSVAVSASAGKATVSWVPGFNGGTPIQSYKVVSSPGGNICTVNAPSTQCVIDNLKNGSNYTFSVIAVNDAGSSQPLLSTSTLIAGTPSAPVALKVKPGDGMITVTFAPPAVALNGGTPIINYTVYVNDEVACTVAPAKLLTCMVNDLENGTPQIVRVTSNNLVGTSASTAEVVATPGRVAGPVTDVTATQGVGLLTISWTEPDDDGGSPITGYSVTLTPGGKTCKVNQDSTSCDISGLTIGTTYAAKVVAINGVGTSVAAISPSVKVVGAPTAVRNLTATGLAKSAKVYFAVPANNGGSALTNYYFSVVGPAGFTWESGPVVASSVKGSYTITGLTKNSTYTISVTVDNEFGMSVAATTTVKSK